ncbi:MAG: CvpA family protein [Clostridiales bacterium]|jgi:uncharacterized membrane protein required for colicin V production|nr:CvpA family protein [Clostridiales bacterium]
MDRNWLDIGVLVVIGVFFLIGLSSGLIFSAFRLVSMVIAMFMSLSFYEKLAGFIYGTYAETLVYSFISDGFRSNPEASAAQLALDVDGVLAEIIQMLRLPNGVAEAVFSKPASLDVIARTDLFSEVDIIGYFSTQCTRAVISLLCVIVVYVVIRTLISILKIFLDELAALKIFRLFNYIGGPVFGLVEGIATVYVALALIMTVNLVVQFPLVYELLDKSRFASGLYENNLYLDFVLRRIHF